MKAIVGTKMEADGFNARYLTDGLFGIMDILRGDKAKDYMQKIK